MTRRANVPRAGAAVLALLILFGTLRPCWAAPIPEDPLTLKQAGRDFLHDAGQIWTSPLRVKAKHVGPIIALAAATTILIAFDEDIRDAVQEYAGQHTWVGDVGPAVTEMGSIGALAAAGAFFGAGLLFKDERARDTGYLAASAMAQTFLVDSVLKGLSGRQRPGFADGTDHWAGPAGFIKRFDEDEADRYTSFPSGHTATAFSLATVVALQYRHRIWMPILAYTVAAGVGLSRMGLDRHWASDVLVGAVVGHLVARLVVRNHLRRPRVVPVLACSGRAITLTVRFELDPASR